MTIKEIKKFLSKYSDNDVVYVDAYEGLYEINKELCGCFKDENGNTCPSLHIELIHKW